MRGFLLVPALAAAALVYALLDQESGIGTWLEMREDLASSRERITSIRREIGELRRDAAALESDPFAIESAIREDLDLSEHMDSAVSSLRIVLAADESITTREVVHLD